MSGDLGNDILVLPITDDFERLSKIFEDVRPTKIYILYNEKPRGIDEEVNEKLLNEVRGIVEENTLEHDEVVERGTDFYEFERALQDAYQIVMEEDQKGNDIYVNLVGGTRPVALALTYACSLAGAGEPIYYASKKAEQAEKGLTTTGVIDQSFELLSIPAFDIQNLVPEHQVKANILTTLSEMDANPKVSDILIHEGEIEKRGPSGISDKEERSNKIKRYSNHAKSLLETGLVEQNSQEYELTNVGEIAASLIQIRTEIEGPVAEE